MTDAWNERAELYRTSKAHSEGADLDLFVEWAAGARTALDVATGGGHVARRLREAGLEVVSCDPAPGMQPDVICSAEHLPFADASFDVVACRASPRTTSPTSAGAVARWRVSRPTACSSVDNLFAERAGRAGRAAARPLACPHTTARQPVARALRAAPGSTVESVRTLRVRPTRSRALARAHRLRGRRRPSVSASCSPTASRRRGRAGSTPIAAARRASAPDGDPRRRRRRVSSSRASPAARAASTACATARTARTSSPV